MERLLVKKFVQWLDGSSTETITAHRERCVAQLNNPLLKSNEAKRDVRLCIRLIDEEISVRLELFEAVRKQA